jgi:hypothetical protein
MVQAPLACGSAETSGLAFLANRRVSDLGGQRDAGEAPGGNLAAAVDAGAPPAERGDQLAAALATSLASRPALCDLTSPRLCAKCSRC